MYSPEAISALSSRIGWNKALEAAFPITISSGNLSGTSGKHFQSFHQLVSVENIYACVPDREFSEADFNLLLADLRNQAVLSVVPIILDSNPDYVQDTDYSATIISNVSLFDDAIGYKCAMSVLEMFVSSGRKNFHERNTKLAIENLKLEIEGFKHERGTLVAAGIVHKLSDAISKASRRFFPISAIIKSDPIW